MGISTGSSTEWVFRLTTSLYGYRNFLWILLAYSTLWGSLINHSLACNTIKRRSIRREHNLYCLVLEILDGNTCTVFFLSLLRCLFDNSCKSSVYWRGCVGSWYVIVAELVSMYLMIHVKVMTTSCTMQLPTWFPHYHGHNWVQETVSLHNDHPGTRSQQKTWRVMSFQSGFEHLMLFIMNREIERYR